MTFTPTLYDYLAESSDSVAASIDGEVMLASCIIGGSRSLKEDAYSLDITDSEGFAAILACNTDGTLDTRFAVETWRLSDQTHVANSGLGTNRFGYFEFPAVLVGQTPSDTMSVFSGLAPLPYPWTGWVGWRATGLGASSYIAYCRNGYFSDGSGGAAWATKSTVTGFTGITGAGTVTDCAPLSRPYDPMFIVTKAGVTTSGSQVHVVRMSIDRKATPTATFDTASISNYEYDGSTQFFTSDNWTGATAADRRPDSVLDIQQIPHGAKRIPGKLVALMGNAPSPDPTIHKVVERPRLAILNPPSGSNVGSTSISARPVIPPMGIIRSHADQSTYNAHGMVCNEQGGIYVVGTGDIVNNVANRLICLYDPDTFELLASVSHDSNDLGDGYVDPLDTHICNPVWDGRYLWVQDHDASKTRIFVYGADLTFINSFQISTASVSAGLRVRGGKYMSKFWSKYY